MATVQCCIHRGCLKRKTPHNKQLVWSHLQVQVLESYSMPVPWNQVQYAGQSALQHLCQHQEKNTELTWQLKLLSCLQICVPWRGVCVFVYAHKYSKALCESEHIKENYCRIRESKRGREYSIQRKSNETKHQSWNLDLLNKFLLSAEQNATMSTRNDNNEWEDLNYFWVARFFLSIISFLHSKSSQKNKS